MVAAEDIAGYWNDLNVVIFAGCSILDIDNKAGRVDPEVADPTASPGRRWVSASGADCLLGYCWKAPCDDQGGVQILTSWCAKRSALGDVAAWMSANDNRCGRNACAIQRIDDSRVCYWYFSREKGFLYNSYSLTNVIEVIDR